MSKTPLDIVLARDVEWTVADTPEKPEGLYATHFGVWDSPFGKIRCYTLNDGQAVFDADDFERLVLKPLAEASK